jgi:hypothetical protein
MIVRCPSCQQKLNAEAGRRVRCPKCQTVFATQVEDTDGPDGEDAPEPAARAPAGRAGLVVVAIAVLFVVGAGGVLIGLTLRKAKGPAGEAPKSGQVAAAKAPSAEPSPALPEQEAPEQKGPEPKGRQEDFAAEMAFVHKHIESCVRGSQRASSTLPGGLTAASARQPSSA